MSVSQKNSHSGSPFSGLAYRVSSEYLLGATHNLLLVSVFGVSWWSTSLHPPLHPNSEQSITDPDWDTIGVSDLSDLHQSQPACAVLHNSLAACRITSASTLQHRSLQAAPTQYQWLDHLHGLAVICKCSKKHSREHPLGTQLFSSKEKII